jgi:hypothetical protein
MNKGGTMLATKQAILDRYTKKEMIVDKLGRMIGVVNLKFSERLAVQRMAETENTLALAHMLAGAAVREISTDGQPPIIYPFPRTLEQLNAVIDVLDDEGMIAATAAWFKLRGIAPAGDDAAKNSQPTPASSHSAS